MRLADRMWPMSVNKGETVLSVAQSVESSRARQDSGSSPVRLAVIVSHPIQHFAPWHRELAKLSGVELRVFFCCKWGVEAYADPDFGTQVQWDIPLLEGYKHEFLPIAEAPKKLTFGAVDNPKITEALDHYNPDVVQSFGYAYRTNWRAAQWCRKRNKPLLLYSDTNANTPTALWKRVLKSIIVRKFYSYVDAALFVGDNNRTYHERYGIPDSRLFAGTMPIDANRLLSAVPDRAEVRRQVRSAHGIPDDAFVVAFCGKYTANKCPLDLVAAVHQAARDGANVWALMIGDGSERGNLEEFCRLNKVRNCTLTGFINQSKVPRYLVAADALALMSARDQHPLVVVEAGTFGLPVIASDSIGCIGPNDTARVGVNALIYPWGDRRALQQAIESLSSDTELYKRMSAGAVTISESQDVGYAAQQLADAALSLVKMGKRPAHGEDR